MNGQNRPLIKPKRRLVSAPKSFVFSSVVSPFSAPSPGEACNGAQRSRYGLNGSAALFSVPSSRTAFVGRRQHQGPAV